MKRNSDQRGVALVITLVMLSLVTFMAVVFLAVSRREKASVAVISDISNARLMVDAALARAQSEIAARMLASTNPFDYGDLLVSTNYSNPAGFNPSLSSSNALNVNFERRANGTPMRAGPAQNDRIDWVRNIANLQYDARVPVSMPTSLTGLQTNDFRFFIDFNRNGWFEQTGWVPLDDAGHITTSTRTGISNYFVGDPQWIGVLERPDRPHSDSNPFIGRYAFAILPTGRSLDINFMHNDAKRIRTDLSQPGFLRHQGVGSWEINLAGFLVGLNTNANAWGPLAFAYNYNTSPGFPSSGTAFEDATAILRHRYERNLASLAPANRLLSLPAGANAFTTNGIDFYSDGPLTTGWAPADNVNLPWSGSFSTNGYYDIQELFDPNRTSAGFVQRLMTRSTNSNPLAYDRYTYYRLLSQLGTESGVPQSNKVWFADFQQHYTNRMHLHYRNYAPNGQTNFESYRPLEFFMGAADRMLRASLDRVVLTNGARRDTNFMLGLTPVRQDFCCTNIQLYNVNAGRMGPPFYTTNNEYSAATHRLFQLAANIHDATTVRRLGTTNDYPSVFRPVFTRTATNLLITGFIEETNVLFLNNAWMTMEQAMRTFPANEAISSTNLYGVPLVIGTKRGYPNFNKMVIQTVAEVSRRLEIRKPNLGSLPNQTNQMYVISVTNRFGVEAWNSYLTNFNRRLEMRVANQSVFSLSNRLEGVSTVPTALTNRLWFFGSTNTFNSWPGWTNQSAVSAFIVPIETNIVALPLSAYSTRNGTLSPVTTNAFESSYRSPQWFIRMTNQLQYALIDRSVSPPRIIDFVNLDNLVTEVDLTRGLQGDASAGGGGIFSDKNQTGGQPGTAALSDNDMWNPTHPGGNLNSPSLGILNQLAVSKGQPYVGEGTWRSATGQIDDKTTSIKQFKEFLEGRLTNLVWQAPFTPSRRLYQRTTWEANDPLVHYTMEDLSDPQAMYSTNLLVHPIPFTFDYTKDALLRELNPRFRPWGGNPRKQTANDPTAYAITLKDSLVWRSDDWRFPTNHFANIGWLGRVHRGTPWQTMYLKSPLDPQTGKAVDVKGWQQWSGSFGTHPTNDWRLLDLFTVAPTDNASRGLLAVNQTNTAAWSAVLSGVTVYTNTTADGAIAPSRRPIFAETYIAPGSPQMRFIVEGVAQARSQQNTRVFPTIGDVLNAPELTTFSPFINNRSQRQLQNGVDDEAYERIPQQILGLLKTDEPRVTVYAFGQSLRPAPRSLVTVATIDPPIFNLCTNYQVTGEFAAKAVLRIEEMPPEVVAKPSSLAPVARKMRAVMESYTVLQSD